MVNPSERGTDSVSGLLLKNITEEGVVVAYQNHDVPISVLSQWADD